ncbi:MAG: hypothetical protein ACKOAR_11055 [Bacteroidota bacterium]
MRKLLSVGIAPILLLLASCGGDPTPPKIEFQSLSSQVLEGGGTTVSFNIPTPEGVTPVFTLSGTATENQDYTYSVNSNGLVFTTEDDGSYDPDETIVITLTDFGKGATLGTQSVHTITIKETPLVIEFQSVTSTRIEGQSIVAALNQPLPGGVVPTYKVTGTASASTDYTLTATSNGFVVAVAKDPVYDNGETVIIELTAISGNAGLGAKKTFTVTITDEDESSQPGLKVNLSWEALDQTTTDVDVDLLVWLETSPGVYTAQGGLWSAIIGTSPEFSFIPSNEVNGKYALSYIYYSGTSNNLKVKVDFQSFKGNINGTSNRASYSKTYTLANINTYSDPYPTPLFVAQTFTKTAGEYTELSDFKVATSGSRTGNVQFILDDKSRKIIESKRSARRPN